MEKPIKFGRDCPKELQDLFDVLNDLPVGEAAIDRFTSRFFKIQEKAIGLYDSSMNAYDTAALFTERYWSGFDKQDRNFKKIRDWHDRAIAKLKHPKVVAKVGLKTEWGSRLRLQELYNEKAVLRSIVNSFKEWDRTTGRLNPVARYKLTPPLIEFGFNPDSSVKASSFEIWELLTRKQVPIERIGICPQCQRFHWKKKLGISKTCGTQKCADAQNHRETKNKEGKK